MEPLNVSRENFPKSTDFAEGMKVLNPVCDNFELLYEYDVPYLKHNDHYLYLQIIKPISEKPLPLIVYIPGSAFHKQDVKKSVAQLAMLAVRGYTIALLEYTPSEEKPFPRFILDAKSGIKFMKDHSETYHIDKNNVFVMGDSSGAYTALMAGLTNGITDLEDNDLTNGDYTVNGMIDFYGPTDITTMNNVPSSQDHRTPDSPEGCMIGGYNVLESAIAQKTIIKNYINDGRELPPVIMFHGSNDELVPFSQSCELYSAMKQSGKQISLYQIDGAHHGDRQFWSSEVLDLIQNFIESNRRNL